MRKIAIMTAIIMIIASLFSLCACNAIDTIAPTITEPYADTISNVENGDENTDVQGVFLSMSSEAISASDDDPMTRKVVATVYPADAKDKSVDWVVAWGDKKGAIGEASDYLAVTPDSDGSCEATVTCIKPFELATIYVKAVTRVGGYSADIKCTYSGAAVTFTINFEQLLGSDADTYNNAVVEQYDANNPLRNGTSTRTVYNILDAERHSANIHLLDALGAYARDYDEIKFDVDVKLIGSFNVGLYLDSYEEGDSVLAFDLVSSEIKETKTINGSTMFLEMLSNAESYADGYYDDDIDFTINEMLEDHFKLYLEKKESGSQYSPKKWYIKVQPLSSLNYLSGVYSNDSAAIQMLYTRYEGSASAEDIYLPYFEVSISYKNTTVKFNVRGVYSTPTSVALDTATIEF